MAGKGPPPKRPGRGQGKRRKHDAELEAEPAKPPKLPRRKGGWTTATRRYWKTIWESPMASRWIPADVPALVNMADLHDRLDRLGPDENVLALKFIAELRLQEARFGLAPDARLRLQWDVRPPEEKPKRSRPKRDEEDPRNILFRDWKPDDDKEQ